MDDIRDDERNPGSQVGPYEDDVFDGDDDDFEDSLSDDQDLTDEDIAQRALRALQGEGPPLRGERIARDEERDWSEAERAGYEESDSTLTPQEQRDAVDDRCPRCGQIDCVCDRTTASRDSGPDALERLTSARRQDAWFHGDEREIWNRIAALETALVPVRQLIDSGFGSEAHVIAEAETEEELRTLRETAAVYSESLQEEFLENLPGGTVAMDYGDLMRGGVLDPGYDDGTPLYAAAYAVSREAATYNWEAFATRGARDWMRKKAQSSPEMLEHEMVTRYAAVDFARDKTMVIMDPVRRAAIVDAFVTEAERARRDEVRRLEQTTARRQAAADRIERTTSSRVQDILDEEGLDWV